MTPGLGPTISTRSALVCVVVMDPTKVDDPT